MIKEPMTSLWWFMLLGGDRAGTIPPSSGVTPTRTKMGPKRDPLVIESKLPEQAERPSGRLLLTRKGEFHNLPQVSAPSPRETLIVWAANSGLSSSVIWWNCQSDHLVFFPNRRSLRKSTALCWEDEPGENHLDLEALRSGFRLWSMWLVGSTIHSLQRVFSSRCILTKWTKAPRTSPTPPPRPQGLYAWLEASSHMMGPGRGCFL